MEALLKKLNDVVRTAEQATKKALSAKVTHESTVIAIEREREDLKAKDERLNAALHEVKGVKNVLDDKRKAQELLDAAKSQESRNVKALGDLNKKIKEHEDNVAGDNVKIKKQWSMIEGAKDALEKEKKTFKDTILKEISKNMKK